MPIYPIEISPTLNKLIKQNQLDSAKSFDESNNEKSWIKAIAYIECNETSKAIELLEKVIKTDNNFSMAAQVELIILQPLKYFNNKEVVTQLRKQIKKLPKQRLLARLLHALSILMRWHSNIPQALKYLHQCRNIYIKLDEKTGLARILDTLGNTSRVIADHQNALLYYTESLALKTLSNDRQGQAITLGNLGRLCLQLGRYQQARSFVELDIELCDDDATEIKSRLFNLLARIDIADKKFTSADNFLHNAIALLKPEQTDSLFFCIKDQITLLIKQDKLEGLQRKISELEKLLPENSAYHQVHFQIIKNQSAKEITLSDAEELLNAIESLDLPELELEYRLWLGQLAHQQNNDLATQQHLLLTRKIAKRYGFERFYPQINSLMLQLNITENINEETMRTITDEISQVDDGYLIRQRLGGGGFGDVYLAHDMINDKDVAIKQFHTGNLMDYNQQKSLWNQARLEFEAVAHINHPSIAKVLAIGNDNNGTPYLVQEYIPGGDLSRLMQQSNNLTTALTYLMPITRALAAIHSVGVIHRDIKPENILINQQGTTVLVDFGIALLKHGTIKNNKIQGTEHYTAPEQMHSTDIDHKADLFSLGCVFYEWLSGKPVEIQHTKTTMLSSLLSKNSQTVCEIDKAICGKAYDLICQLLTINSKDRPKNAAVVADEMEKIIK